MQTNLICIALLAASSVYAQDISNIHSELTNDLVHAKYSIGSPVHKWGNSEFNWLYNPAFQPAGMSTDTAVNIIKAAANKWSGMCNITFNYLGTTVSAPIIDGTPSSVDFRNVIGWGVPPTAHSTSLYGRSKWSSNSDNNLADTDILFNSTLNLGAADFDGGITAALGGVIGLNDSNVDASVLATRTDITTAYMRTLRGDDAAGCAALYGVASTAESNRAFNWAEAALPQLLTPSPAASGNALGYYYRYYSGTNSYVGTKDGSVFFMGPDGVIQNLGPLSAYASRVQSAGF